MVRLEDLKAAESAVDTALEELRAYSEVPERWAAHERLGDNDMKTLVIHKSHFEKLEFLQRNVEQAAARLQATQAAFAGITGMGG